MYPETKGTTMARKTTAHLFYSVDGVAESPDKWQFDQFGPEEGEMMGRAIGTVSDVVMGRKLWQEWAEYWPGAQDPFGAFINPVRKHVISSTLHGDLGWNSTLATGDPVAYVKELASGEGGDITVVGGVETTRQLFLGGAIDELTLTMHPVIAGTGRRLFDDTIPVSRLRLLNSTPTSVGNVVLTYGLRD